VALVAVLVGDGVGLAWGIVSGYFPVVGLTS